MNQKVCLKTTNKQIRNYIQQKDGNIHKCGFSQKLNGQKTLQ